MIKKVLVALAFIFIIALGTIIRFNNLSNFKIYPDSYQSLIVAKNLQNYHHVVGRLGEQGMVYPDFISWTRPLYPLLINFTHNAQLLSVISGIITLGLVFFGIHRLFNSTLLGLGASILLVLSFNHVVWGGFILTETTASLFLCLFLFPFLWFIKKPSVWADVHDLLVGTLFTLAVLSRYEYAALLFPVTLLIFITSPTPKKKVINILSSSFFVFSLFLVAILPPTLFTSVFTQAIDSLKVIFGAVFVLFLFFIFIKNHLLRLVNYFIPAVLIALAFILILQIIFGPVFHFLYTPLTALRDFVRTDFLLSFLFLLGIFPLLRSQKYKPLAYFCLLSVVILGAIYFQINHEMQRYWTHLIPFFLIPASFVFNYFKKPFYFLKLFLFILLLCFQFFTSWSGLKNWSGGAWYKPDNYEEIVAARIKNYIKPQDLLLVSLPEPYYLITGNNIYSLAPKFPYVYISSHLDNQNIFIVEDAGMLHEFPEFSNFISKNLYPYEETQFFTGLSYYFGPEVQEEKIPVKLYKIKLSELKILIAADHP